jgi:adenine/guanine phosphoribosyltransferase-like PRPP-binding protein
MTIRIVSEPEFQERLRAVLAAADTDAVGFVTGPGRSGAVAAVYASHILAVPFIPFGAEPPVHLGRALIIDTARESGETLKKAARRYRDADPLVLVAFEEPPRVAFWYEAPKPQRYRHERPLAA